MAGLADCLFSAQAAIALGIDGEPMRLDVLDMEARIMQHEDTGAVPVTRDGRVLAMVTDRDIVVRVVAEGGSLTSPVGDIATKDVICATPDMSTKEANDLMSEHQIRRLPVVEDGCLVGIVSIGDLAVKEGADSRVGDTLELSVRTDRLHLFDPETGLAIR